MYHDRLPIAVRTNSYTLQKINQTFERAVIEFTSFVSISLVAQTGHLNEHPL